jgi:acyl transferase domain-containing protein
MVSSAMDWIRGKPRAGRPEQQHACTIEPQDIRGRAMMGALELKRPAPVVWMFPGQGVQYFQMGKVLYDGNETFRSWIDRLDAVAADYVGQPIVDVVYDRAQSRSQPFDHILYTHPALFMVQYAMARTLLSAGFPPPDYLLGASLGEFVAAAVADAAEPEDMLFDLVKQARLFEAHCSGGAMLAVIDDIDTFHSNPVFSEGCELAGVNFDRCFVVSGMGNRILHVAAELKRQDVLHQLLPVSVAFHSSLVENVRDLFIRTFASTTCRPAKIPVISCAVPFDGAPDETAFSSAYWWRVIRQPIEFGRTLAQFAQGQPDAVYVDVGPSGTMASFAKYLLPQSVHDRILPVMTPFGNDREGLAGARARMSALLGAGRCG